MLLFSVITNQNNPLFDYFSVWFMQVDTFLLDYYFYDTDISEQVAKLSQFF